MDLKDISNKTVLQQSINKLMNDYETMLIDLSNGSDDDYHKAALLYYWLKEYKQYLLREKKFNPKFLKSYQRGDLISVNFGFNIGSEFGGRHYAVVIEDSPRSSDTLTLIPLRSKKNKDSNGVHWAELELGNDLYNKFTAKVNSQQSDINSTIRSLNQELEETKKFIADIDILKKEHEQDTATEEFTQTIKRMEESSNNRLTTINQKLANLEKKLSASNRCIQQFASMKFGSVALIKQITTISKMRIFDPTNEDSALAGIKLSNEYLDRIDEKLRCYYLRK